MFGRRRRMVRVHLKENGPSVSGFLKGRYAGHYVLELPRLHEAVDSTVQLDGIVSIPVGNVLLIQTLTGVAE